MKRRIVTKLITISLGFIFVFCATSNKIDKSDTKPPVSVQPVLKYEHIAKDKYSGDLKFIPNPGNTYMLCINHLKPTNENPFPSFSYFIYDLAKDEVIYEDSESNGDVNWKNNDQLMIHIFPGQIKTEDDKPVVYIYDIKKQKKFIDEIIKD
ncbi:MAG: hypothetical protein V1779_12740 [bacterium]